MQRRQSQTALVDLINQKRRQADHSKEGPRGDNVVDLMVALRRSVGVAAAAAPTTPKNSTKKSKKTAPSQEEMVMPIAGKKPAKESAAKKPSAKPQRVGLAYVKHQVTPDGRYFVVRGRL